jgi:catechol 2,3-dioxygenase-like lactoylglutathione lyase family enzyme
MTLTCVNIVTTDVARMRDFYTAALHARYDESHGGPNRCEILTDGATLVLCRTDIPPTVHPDECSPAVKLFTFAKGERWGAIKL